MTAMLDSLRPADSARSAETTQHRRPTSKDILAGGYNCQREIPEPVECEFCGRKLYHEALVMGRTVLMFAPFPQRCTCDRAKAKWAEADAEEARQKAEAEKEAAQAKRRAKIERLLGRSGIKKRFQQRTFTNFIRDTPERKRCYDTAKTYADSFPQRAERGEGLYIEGTYGTGKTHLAAAIALQLIGCGVPVVCKTSGDLLADIKEAFDSGDATEYEILKAYKTVDLLIVDDLGKEQCTEWSVSTLYSILNDRYENILFFFSIFPCPSVKDINRWVAPAIVALKKPNMAIAPPTILYIPKSEAPKEFNIKRVVYNDTNIVIAIFI